ncbi:unnamed protein product [Colias eurytheme]|nr:unnamed protein product [Colias eurytheme]
MLCIIAIREVPSHSKLHGEGRITGLLGSLQVPFLLSGEVQEREERMLSYFRSKISKLSAERDELISNAEHYVKECEMLRLRFEELQQEKETDANTIQDKHDTIARLEEELHSTSHNYEQQMSVLTEHVAALNDRLAEQHDQLLQLKHQLARKK